MFALEIRILPFSLGLLLPAIILSFKTSKVTALCKLVADGDERYLNFDVLNDSIIAGSRSPKLKGRILISKANKDETLETYWESIYN